MTQSADQVLQQLAFLQDARRNLQLRLESWRGVATTWRGIREVAAGGADAVRVASIDRQIVGSDQRVAQLETQLRQLDLRLVTMQNAPRRGDEP